MSADNSLLGYGFVAYACGTLILTTTLSNSTLTVPSAQQAPISNTVTTQQKPAAEVTATPKETQETVTSLKSITGKTPNTPPAIKPQGQQRPDFSSIRDVKVKKQAFFDYLLPSIAQENQRMSQAQMILQDWQHTLSQGGHLDSEARTQLNDWSVAYRVVGDTSELERVEQLMQRMDVIPASMVLAQGAMESAWGTSRFARKANNYFGQWCFSKGCGLIPAQRDAGAAHEVAKFDGIDQAVTAYFNNINRHSAYQRVRDERWALRQAQAPLDSLAMVQGLDKYSARGHAYIEELQSMIRYNKLKRYDEL